MAAGRYSFVIEQGATFELAFTWKDETGVPIDLTGYTAKLEIRDQPDTDGTLILRFSTSPAAGEGAIALGGAAGTVTLSADADLTIELDDSRADALFYDLELTNGVVVTRLLQGTVTVSPRVTV